MTAVNVRTIAVPSAVDARSPEHAQVVRTTRAHVPALDGVRGMAILLVMLHHFIAPAAAGPTGSVLLGTLQQIGWVGVDLFFVLSGFLITGILFDAKGRSKYFTNFFMRRALRILPLQYGVLLFVLLVWLPLKPVSMAAFEGNPLWLFTHLVTVPLTLDGQWSFGLFDSFWSLAIEEQFYLLWPLAVVRFGRTGLIRLCIALWAISFATRVGMCWAGASWISVYVFTPGRLDGLVCGAILALLARGPEGLTAYRTPIRWMGLAALATLVGIGVATGGLSNEHTLVLTVGILALAVLSGAVVASAAQGGSLLSSLASVPFLQFLGTYSYGLYIFNLPVSKLVMNSDHLSSMLPDGYLSRTLLLIVINFAICLAIAVPCYHLFEMQFLKLKRKFQ